MIVPESYEGLVRPQLGDDGTVEAGAAFQLAVFRVAQVPDLLELSLTWLGQDSPVRVPLPPR